MLDPRKYLGNLQSSDSMNKSDQTHRMLIPSPSYMILSGGCRLYPFPSSRHPRMQARAYLPTLRHSVLPARDC